jgi:hypothetical protein
MKKASFFAVLAGLLFSAGYLGASTVIPPTFDELVNKAEVILQGSVTNTQSMWIGEGAQRHIVTYVTFKVEDALKGDPGQTYTIRMFGGEVNGQGMAIADAPKFNVGDREIIFVENNGSQLIPLVGMMYGRFHIQKDGSGRDIVTTAQGEPVKDVGKLGMEEESVTPAEAISTENFKAAIKAQLGE